MRIFDENNVEITSPDLSLGYLVQEEMFVAHHEAIEELEEQWRYETVAEYPNGGKDVSRVIDVPGVEAKEAWDEYETVQRYILYTDEELAEMESKRPVTWYELDEAYKEGYLEGYKEGVDTAYD